MSRLSSCILNTNYRCSKQLLDACLARGIRLLYAFAATYASGNSLREKSEVERQLNIYGHTKLLIYKVVAASCRA